MRSLAMLDAILCPDWQFRYFSYDSHWSRREQLGSVRDGQGDHLFALFSDEWCWIKGFAHEAAMPGSPDGRAIELRAGVPIAFAECLTEPAFDVRDTTFCAWRRRTDAAWQCAALTVPTDAGDSDGSATLLRWGCNFSLWRSGRQPL